MVGAGVEREAVAALLRGETEDNGRGGGGGCAAVACEVDPALPLRRRLFSGALLGVVATNALELGVDIGSLDAVLMMGYPGTAASMWQQAGRAGRGGRDSTAVLLTYDCPVDQHFARAPDTLTTRVPEAALVDVTIPSILRSHVLCAGAELPLCPWDVHLFGEAVGDVVVDLRRRSLLLQVDAAGGEGVGMAQFAGGGGSSNGGGGGGGGGGGKPLHAFKTAAWVPRPTSRLSLRSIDDVVYRVIDDGNGGAVVDEVEEGRAYWEVHEGAIYMNSGVTYRVRVAVRWEGGGSRRLPFAASAVSWPLARATPLVVRHSGSDPAQQRPL
jgi:DEAD/DEAH box helicase domain-containing protein